MYGALEISTGGMIAQRTRVDVAAANLASAGATRASDGSLSPYQRRVAMLSAGGDARGKGLGVHVAEVVIDRSPSRKVYDPTHPDAAPETDPERDMVEGYVNYGNVDTTVETINALEAARAYEANVMAAEATKSMMAQALRLIA